jgi:8-oxo-dGTP pyrophosphatase MutT (NUDIX family)
MQSYAAGIVPYRVQGDEIYFLLGLEKSNGKWSGFVGSSEKYESVVQTAIREFNEETSMIFQDYLKFFYDACVATKPVIEKTPSGKPVYIWFIECYIETNLAQFSTNQMYLQDPSFKEKTKLQWFSLTEIAGKDKLNIYTRLKSIILKHF